MYQQNTNIRFGGPITPIVKKIMIINGVIFLLQQILDLFSYGFLQQIFGLNHVGLAHNFMFWQIFTYMFLHGGFLHIIFNLLGLWMFAGELEQLWGSKLFLRYYITCGIGAGIFIALMNYFIYIKYGTSPVTLGASGAIYAVLLAYGMTWPNREVLLYFVIPIKIKYLVIAYGLIEFFGTLSSATGSGGNISHIGHLGGIISGLIFIFTKSNFSIKRDTTISKKPDFFSQKLKKLRLRKKQKEIDNRIKAKQIIDNLLEKIAREGMSSLSSDEKRNLEWARKHYYPEGNDTVH